MNAVAEADGKDPGWKIYEAYKQPNEYAHKLRAVYGPDSTLDKLSQ